MMTDSCNPMIIENKVQQVQIMAFVVDNQRAIVLHDQNDLMLEQNLVDF